MTAQCDRAMAEHFLTRLPQFTLLLPEFLPQATG
jgi:hypothetical protein